MGKTFVELFEGEESGGGNRVRKNPSGGNRVRKVSWGDQGSPGQLFA